MGSGDAVGSGEGGGMVTLLCGARPMADVPANAASAMAVVQKILVMTCLHFQQDWPIFSV